MPFAHGRARVPKPTLDILFQDDAFVAVNKPAGLAVIPGRGEAEGETVLERLAAQLGLPASGTADPRVRVVHRLDKDTSGVMLFAKHVAAQRHVSHQFQNNTTSKEYLALVVGRPSESAGEIDAKLVPHPTSKLRMSVVRHGGRPARTRWRIEQPFRHYTLLRVFPKTGKTHQIRVHLKHVGLPLAVDPLYNPLAPGTPVGLFLSSFKRGYRATRGEEERPLIARLTLHAERLRFAHLDGREIDLVAPLPKDFRATLNMLARHD
jgi:23S rRNA pseudouridine955/2504/2580 synthase/23S rRNA pseudouridine1911/1915/1917 synthase